MQSNKSRTEKENSMKNQDGNKNPVLFVGAGPGDPELITVKGQRALMAADMIIYTGSLVPEAVLEWAGPGAMRMNSASMHLEQIVDSIEAVYRDGRKVVRLHTGDPSLYGAIFEQMAQLRQRSVPYRVIPGVTAAFAAAAAMGIEYTLPEICQTLILTRMSGRTPVPETEELSLLAAHRASMAIYLSIGLIDRVADILEDAYGPDGTCAVVFRASQPEEKIICTRMGSLARTIKTENINHQALIIVGKVLDIGIETLRYKSRLYDMNFAHGYRPGQGR